MDQNGLSTEHYTKIENIIYEATVIPEKWPEVLQNLGSVGNFGDSAFYYFVSCR